MTQLSANRFGLKDRGQLKAGAFADLVIFDAEKITDRSTYENPLQQADGIERVIVNGLVAWQEGRTTDARQGRVLKRVT